MPNNRIQYEVGFNVQKQGLQQIKKSLQEIKDLKISEVMKINEVDRTDAISKIASIKEQALRVQQALKEAFNTKLNTINIETFKSSLEGTGSSLQQIYNAFKYAGTAGENAFRTLSSQVLSTNIQLKESHALLDKMATTLANTVKWNVASGAVNAVTRSVQQAWGYVKALDTSLNDIRIVTGKSADEMANFAVQANSAAQTLGRTTTDYTKAALIYAQQGLNDEEIAERTRLTLMTANVTGQSTDAVSEELTAVWNGYKVSAEQAELYVDRLAAVAAKTASDLQELTTGMSKVASAANAMGVGEEQLAAQLSTIISVTRQAPESVGTALRTVYARISDIKAGLNEDGVTLGNYSGKMAELGFNVLDATGNLRDMGEVMEDIGNRWQDLTREQQVSLAQTMAGQRQYSNLIALFDNFEKYNESLAIAQNAAGTLATQQATAMDSTQRHLNTLKASIQNIYDSLINPRSLNPLIDGLSKAANVAANFIDSIGGGAGVLSALGSIGITVFSNQIAKGINTVITNFEIGKENARQFDQTLQAISEWKGIQGLSETTQELLSKREQLLSLAQVMNPEQFNKMQKDLNEVTEATNQVENLKMQKEALESVVLSVTKGTDAWEALNDVMKDENAQKDVIDRIREQELAFSNLSKDLQEYEKSLSATRGKLFNGEDVSQEIEKARQSLNGYISKINTLSDEGKLNVHTEQIEKLKDEFNSLGDLSNEEILFKLQSIGIGLKALTSNAASSSQEIRQKLEQDFQGAAESISNLLEMATKNAEVKMRKFQESLNNISRAVTIENMAKVAGGIAQVGSAIRQVQNLGSIWKNENLSTGQKVLQTVTNLAMSIPMLVRGISNITKPLGLVVTLTKAEALAMGGSIASDINKVFSLKLVQTQANKTAIKLQILNKTLLINPATFWIAGIMAAITALSSFIKYFDEANQKAIEADQKAIEQQNAIQQTLKTNKDFYKALEVVNKKYKQGQISRVELKNSVIDLCEQFEVEDSIINKLTNSYGNLTEAIRQQREEDARTGKESAEKEISSARDEVTKTARGKVTDNARKVGDQYQLTINYGGVQMDEPQKLVNYLKNIEGVQSFGKYLRFSTDFDTESIVELYDQLSKIRDLDLTDAERNSSEYYKAVIKWLDQMAGSVERYKAAIEDLDTYSAELIGYSSAFDFSNIDNAADYYNAREQFIEKLKNDKDINLSGEAEDVADAFLMQNFGGKFNQFDEFTKKAKEMSDQTGESIEDIIKEFSKLDEQHLNILFDSKVFKSITNFEQLKEILENISKLDLSNVSVLYGGEQLRGMQEAAAQRYTNLQQIEDTVKSGKTISKTQFEALQPELQEFFRITTKGTYALKDGADEFYNIIDNKKIEGFADAYNKVNQSIATIQKVSNEYDINKVSRTSAATITSMGGTGDIDTASYSDVNQELVQQQLELLQIFYAQNAEVQQKVNNYKNLLAIGQLGGEQAVQIYNLLKDVQDPEKVLLDALTQGNQAAKQLAHNIYKAMFPTDADVDETELSSLTDVIQNLADDSGQLADTLQQDAYAAQDVAEAILRFDDAIEEVQKNYDDWMAALNSGSIQDQAAVMADLKDAYSDLLDLDGESLSENFLMSTNNLELMKAAIQGNEDAYNQLMEAAQQDIAAQIGLDVTKFDEDFNHLMSLYYKGQNLDDLEIGASLNNQDFLDGLTQMVNAAGMTAQQATDYLASMGVDAEVVEEKTDGTEVNQETGFNAIWKPVRAPFSAPTPNAAGGFSSHTLSDAYLAQTLQYEPNKTTTTTKKQNSAFSLKVTSANKSSGGGFKYKQASHGGGGSNSSRKSGGGGSRGGGGGGSKADTSTKDTKKPLEDTRDIYHDINIQIEQINRNLDRVQKQQDQLYGKTLLDNLNEQTKILEEQKKKLKEKNELQKEDLKGQREALENLGVIFDQYGNIANYMDVLGQKQNDINSLYNEYNALVEQYNASTDKQIKQGINEKIEEVNKRIKNAEDELKDAKDKIKDYDSLRDSMEDLVDEITQITQKQIELNIEKFRMEIKIRLDMGQAERDWNEFKRNVLNHTDVMRDNEFTSIFRDAQQSTEDLYSYFNVHGSIGSIQKLTEQLIATRKEIEDIDNLGESAIYGTNKAQAMEDLQEDLDELMGQMQDVEELIDDIDEAYLDTIDDIMDQFDKQIEDYEFIGELIEHDMDLLSLLYGDKNFDAMEKYYTTLQGNQMRQLDLLRMQKDYWREQWQQATAAGDLEAAKRFEQNYKDTIKNLNSLIQDSAKTLQDKYINAIDGIFDALDRKITNGKGTDYLNLEWDLMNKNADEYLDTINSAFALRDLENQYQDALNNAQGIKAQRTLKQLMDQQLTNLKNKDKLTQYDIDRAQKLLEIEKARIALEQAQNNKTSLRLRRDSQGNYTYEYTADLNSITQAQQNLANSQNDLYNFDKDRYRSNLEDMLAAWKDFQSEYKDIITDTSLTEEDRIRRLALLREQYGQYINDKVAENEVIRVNLTESAFADLAALYEQDVENYTNMTNEEKDLLMGELVPMWKSGIQEMSDAVAGEGGFIPTCQEAFESIDEATQNYEETLQALADVAGISLDDVKTGVDNLAVSFSELIEKNDDLIDRMHNELSAIEQLRNAAHSLKTDYDSVYGAASNAVSGIHNFIQAQQQQAAESIRLANQMKAAEEAATAAHIAKVAAAQAAASVSSFNPDKTKLNSSSNEGSGGGSYTPGGSSPSSLHPFNFDELLKKNKTSTGAGGGARTSALVRFGSGGYTGDWYNNDGRLAVLDKKQQVFNQQDTENILNSAKLLRALIGNANTSIFSQMNDINLSKNNPLAFSSSEGLDQNVYIEASFPNVNSKREIEEAFNDLVNLAAQRALKR